MKGAFEVKQKAFFIIFKELSVAKICLRPESAPLTLSASTLQNGQTHSSNSSVVECV